MSDLAADAEKSPQNKIALRARLLTARRSLSAPARAAAAAKIQDQTLDLVRRKAPRTLAAYVPIGAEPGGPNLPLLLAAALPEGSRLLLPVLLPDNDLDWAAFTLPSPTAVPPSPTSADSVRPRSEASSAAGTSRAQHAFPGLRSGPRGLLEPNGPRLGVDAIREADLVLVPALAVGRDGTRMGRGGGSYDRALARLPTPGPLIVALLHDGEDIEVVPTDPHDRRVHAVITPTGGFSLKPDPEWTN
ncbi:5-formyltetrahydrofolate cyclo-ligase [Actinoplanes sp. NPDC024001]|uniref:5-formyltetrahydrofolate cyclo-ligase n=1 Tax=Actinoplanes sp. NPDC024001 TaxID=3154598 RepID=UPI0033F1141E